MTRATRLTDAKVAKLGEGLHADHEVPGLFVRVRSSGAKTFTIVARDPYGKQKWCAIPDMDVKVHKLADVRPKAREGVKRLKAGLEAFPPPPTKPDTFKATAESYIEHHVKVKGLRSQAEIERCLRTYIYPAWGEREFTSIKRSDVVRLLDAIVKNHGPRQANVVLALVRGVMNWAATRSDDYVVPIVRGMARPVPGGGKRERVLSDDELRLIWPILGERGTFGALVRLALLTGQRADKLAKMRWDDVSIDGVWRIATKPREKSNAGTLALPEMALDVIRAQPRIESNPYIFPARDRKRVAGVDPAELTRPFAGWAPCKRALDQKILEALRKAAGSKEVTPPERWVVHDLRRTSKSLMMRAGVDRWHAEKVLGHVIPGVEGVYDRHDYAAERKHALAALAAQLSRILNPPADNVIEGGFQKAAAQ